MGRKNRPTRHKTIRYEFPRGFHFLYSPDELYQDFVIVRYLGEQDGPPMRCYHPEGFELWCHVATLAIPHKTGVAA